MTNSDSLGYHIGQGKKGLIIIQEWWGINDAFKKVCDKFEKRGQFHILAPDLYHGKVAVTPDEANHLMTNLDWPGAVEHIKKCYDFLKEQGCSKIGITGFCMGGALTIAAAAKIEGLNCAAPFYGIPPANFAKPENVKCPIQCHFGKKDTHVGFADLPTALKLEKAFKDAKIEHEMIFYEAGHAFMNETGKTYDAEVAEQATKNSIEFFNKYLS